MYLPCTQTSYQHPCVVSNHRYRYQERGESGETHRRDLLGQVDRLDDGQLALLDGALEVDVLDLVAQVRLRADQADVAVPDLEVDVGAVEDGLLDGALGLNLEGCAAAVVVSFRPPLFPCFVSLGRGGDLRFGGVGAQDDLVNRDEVVAAVAVAELERVLARHVELAAPRHQVLAAAAVGGARAGGRREGED